VSDHQTFRWNQNAHNAADVCTHRYYSSPAHLTGRASNLSTSTSSSSECIRVGSAISFHRTDNSYTRVDAGDSILPNKPPVTISPSTVDETPTASNKVQVRIARHSILSLALTEDRIWRQAAGFLRGPMRLQCDTPIIACLLRVCWQAQPLYDTTLVRQPVASLQI